MDQSVITNFCLYVYIPYFSWYKQTMTLSDASKFHSLKKTSYIQIMQSLAFLCNLWFLWPQLLSTNMYYSCKETGVLIERPLNKKVIILIVLRIQWNAVFILICLETKGKMAKDRKSWNVQVKSIGVQYLHNGVFVLKMINFGWKER